MIQISILKVFYESLNLQCLKEKDIINTSSQVLTESQDEKSAGATEIGNKVEKEVGRVVQRLAVGRGACRRGSLKRGLKYTGGRINK